MSETATIPPDEEKEAETEGSTGEDSVEELKLAKQQNLKIREANIRDIRSELDSEFNMLLNNEFTELEKISLFAESVANKLQKHYSNMFPKKCNTCCRIYKTREQYLDETKLLQKTSTIYDEVGLQEYRNCVCGSTLVLWSQDRRDNTPYGVARRKLFDECLEKLMKLSEESEEQVRQRLRQIFSRLAA